MRSSSGILLTGYGIVFRLPQNLLYSSQSRSSSPQPWTLREVFCMG